MVIDTNIIIACLKQEPKAVAQLSEWKKQDRALLVSSITIAETLAVPNISRTELDVIKEFLRNFISIPFNDPIAELAASFRRTYNLEIPDAGIAATAFSRNVPLITRDHQFQKVKEITVLEI